MSMIDVDWGNILICRLFLYLIKETSEQYVFLIFLLQLNLGAGYTDYFLSVYSADKKR